MFMKHHLIAWLAFATILISSLNAACSPVAPEPRVTPLPTNTPIPQTDTSTPQPIATISPTQTVAPSKGVITIKPPANPKDFVYAGGLPLIRLSALGKEKLNRLYEIMINEVPFSSCPEVWIEAVPDSQVPTYALFISSLTDDQNKSFAVIIRSSTEGENLDGSVGIGVITPETGGKRLVVVGYSPTEGQPIPNELEIQLIFPGCELHTEVITWP